MTCDDEISGRQFSEFSKGRSERVWRVRLQKWKQAIGAFSNAFSISHLLPGSAVLAKTGVVMRRRRYRRSDAEATGGGGPDSCSGAKVGPATIAQLGPLIVQVAGGTRIECCLGLGCGVWPPRLHLSEFGALVGLITVRNETLRTSTQSFRCLFLDPAEQGTK